MAGKSPYRVKNAELRLLLWQVMREYLFRASKRGLLELEFEEMYRAGFRRIPTQGEIAEFTKLVREEGLALLARKLKTAKTPLGKKKSAIEFIERLESAEIAIEEPQKRKK